MKRIALFLVLAGGTFLGIIWIGNLSAQGEVEEVEALGNKVLCPISGEAFQISEGQEKVTYERKVYYFCCPDCKEPFQQNPEEYLEEGEHHEHPEGEVHIEGEVTEHEITSEEIGEKVVCPISGEKLRVKKGTRALEYKGEVYYLCCPKCIRRFSKDPEKYSGEVHHDESHHHLPETEHHH